MMANASFGIFWSCNRVYFCSSLALAASILAVPAFAQQQPIAYVPTEGVSLSGSLAVENGKASIGNDGTITAGDSTAHVSLVRGGELSLCASTKVHLSKETSASTSNDPAADSALMIALDRGAVEATYTPGKYSDVLLTPDLRILISGPGQADLKIRTNQKGDTCVDNHGANAPYVTVTSQFEGGLYRVQPNQRVMFEHGSLQQVVDNESEPCGCPAPPPPPVAVASTAPGILLNGSRTPEPTPAAPVAKPSLPVAKPAQLETKPAESAATIPLGGPSSTPADTTFPLAVSEGLKPPPAPPTQPAVPPGTPHVQVDVPITYDAKTTPNPAQPGAAGPPPPEADATDATPPAAASVQPPPPQPAPVQAPAPAQTAAKPKTENGGGGFFHSIGRFFSRLFGGR
jgi:hypothetical protein